MTEASTGLRKALARKAGVSQLTTEDLLAQLSDDQKAGLAAALSPAANAGDTPKKATDDEDEDDMETEGDGTKKPKSEKKDDEYMDDEAKAKAATERAVAVMSNEHAQGRMDAAKMLLANDKLSADEIVTILASTAPTTTADPEAAARKEMQDALAETGAPEIEANDGGASKPKANSAGVWDAAYAKVFGTNNAA